MKVKAWVAINLLVLLAMTFFAAADSNAGWLIYHEKELKGKILDIDTKQPVEGAVVVVEYKKATLGLGAGSISSIIDVRETLTDKEGNFRIPSYTTVIQPFSWQIPNTVIIFKPGYASPQVRASYFSGEETRGQDTVRWNSNSKYKVTFNGVIEISKLSTREEKLHAVRSADLKGEVPIEKIKILIHLVNAAYMELGIMPYKED